MKYTGTLAVTIGILWLFVLTLSDAHGQHQQLPTTHEVKGNDYVVTDKTVIEQLARIEGKIDWLMQQYEPEVVEEYKNPRVNLNTLSEQDIVVLMQRTGVRSAEKKAVLLWAHIHEGGGPITDFKDYEKIPGIGETTFRQIWPEVKLND